ncbi:PDZ domain-containing protein [Bradyrhizobium sp. SZCCHNR1065]|uniref:PDZ domain-containing protein n=1 Tax=unclassified Bradyrhizobium TaxID=2631580 RepID=UPI003966DDD5
MPQGDIIPKANKIAIHSATQMRNLIGLTPVGQQVRLTIERKNETENVTVEIEPFAEQKGRQRTAG